MMQSAPPGDLRAPLTDDSLSKHKLRVWIRMLAVTRVAEARLRNYLRREHDTTLPRFDVMAALWRRGEPISMTELSRMLLVSNGNVTAICDPLEKSGIIVRLPCDADRRTIRVGLTKTGRALFDEIAVGHEAEISDIFAALDEDELDQMRNLLRKMGNS